MASSHFLISKLVNKDVLGSPVVKNPPSKVGDVGLIPGQETKTPHPPWCGQLNKKKCYKTMVIKTVQYWYRTNLCNGGERLEINPIFTYYIY